MFKGVYIYACVPQHINMTLKTKNVRMLLMRLDLNKQERLNSAHINFSFIIFQ